jgi:type I restriction enzyme M protein
MPSTHSRAESIRALRAKLNLSQEQLADRLGVSFATVNRWEAGKAKPQRAQQDAIDRLMQEAAVDGQEPAAFELPSASARRRRGIARSTVLGTKSMEQMLWDAACSIRGEKDAPKFKDYLLPLLFLKRLSDVFDDEIARLTEEYRDRDVALEVAEGDHSVVRFYVPREARWAAVSGRETFAWPAGKAPKSLGEHLTLATRAVVRHNPDLAGVLDVVDFAAEHNGEREVSDAALKGVVETFSDPRYRLGLKDVEPDFLGRCYEYLLRKFAEGSGQSAGEFFTPREVGFLMARVLRPRPGEECHDYACGSAGLLIKLQLVCREVDPLSRVPLRLYGQERQRESYAVAWMNTIVHDMQADVQRGDSMRNPKFRNAVGSLKRFDIVIANPMWNQPFEADVYDTDAFGRFKEQGGITAGKGDWAWLQHTLACLKDDGRAAVVLDTGAVTRGSGSKNEDRERNIRKWFVEQDVIEGVILLPDNLFYNTTAAGVIVVLNKRKPKERQGKIVLLNAGRHVRKGSPKNYIPEEDIANVAEAFVKADPVDGLAKIITIEEATRNDFNLSPSRYVGGAAAMEAGDIAALVNELRRLSAEERQLSEELESALAPLIAAGR